MHTMRDSAGTPKVSNGSTADIQTDPQRSAARRTRKAAPHLVRPPPIAPPDAAADRQRSAPR
jgi:hypothetical protein